MRDKFEFEPDRRYKTEKNLFYSKYWHFIFEVQNEFGFYISANIKEVMWLYVWYVIKWKNEIWIEFYFDVVSIGNEIGYSQIWMGDKFELQPDIHYKI
jgi:hypothetical protein